MKRFWYGPPEWLARCLTAKDRRAINFWLLIAWLVPGTILWFLLRDAIWFIGFMSVYAIWTGHLGALAAETPTESE